MSTTDDMNDSLPCGQSRSKRPRAGDGIPPEPPGPAQLDERGPNNLLLATIKHREGDGFTYYAMCKELGSSHAYLLPGPPVTWPPAQLTEVVSFAREIVRHKYNGGHKNQVRIYVAGHGWQRIRDSPSWTALGWVGGPQSPRSGVPVQASSQETPQGQGQEHSGQQPQMHMQRLEPGQGHGQGQVQQARGQGGEHSAQLRKVQGQGEQHSAQQQQVQGGGHSTQEHQGQGHQHQRARNNLFGASSYGLTLSMAR